MPRKDHALSDAVEFQVIVSEEEQYSIWPILKEIPFGWKQTGHCGTKSECLAYIETVWTDMRPLSLRRKIAEAAEAAQQ